MWRVAREFLVKAMAPLAICLCVGLHSHPVRAEQDSPIDALRAADFLQLDQMLNQAQADFESGKISDVELRDRFSLFLDLDLSLRANLYKWAETYPNSYAAHLALGTFLRRTGQRARGEAAVQITPEANIKEMEQIYAEAGKELDLSSRLAKKPILTLFNQMIISIYASGYESYRAQLLAQANIILPSESIVRDRYMMSLRPEWGGSVDEMKTFVEETEQTGVDISIINQLRAMIYDVLIPLDWHADRKAKAIIDAQQALQLAKLVGGSFRADYLPVVERWVCMGTGFPQLETAYCGQDKTLAEATTAGQAPTNIDSGIDNDTLMKACGADENSLQFGFCGGFIAGIADLLLAPVNLPDGIHISSNGWICPDQSAINLHSLAGVYASWGEQNIDKLKFPASKGVRVALLLKYPCKPD